MALSLVNVAKYYQGLPNQEKALQILQAELERTNPELLRENAEFIQIWRTPNDPQSPNHVLGAAAVIANNPVGTSALSLTESTRSSTLTEARTWSVDTAVATATAPNTVNLDIPYFSQLDNVNNPHGSCNVTSLAMCMAYLGHSSLNSSGEQLEDELYCYCSNKGLSRHSPTDLAQVVQAYGYKDDFQPDAKWGDVKRWLADGKPIVIHGWFSRSGHIIVIKGYNDKGWIVNDPYGEWYEWGYDTSVSGKNLTYTYGMMREICGSDGDLWIHYISK